MKLRLSIVLAAAVMALALAATADAQAFEFTGNESVPFSFVTDACGEPVQVSGTLHLLFHVTISDSGSFTFHDHAQPQGASGTGLVSGATYRATGVTSSMANGNASGGQFETTAIDNFRMIGRGKASNFDVHETLHVTVNNNGVVTVAQDKLSVACRG